MADKDVDIAIVGSGAGGGTVAAALAPLCRDGARIAVLEWGPRLRPEELTGRELEMANRLYVDGGGMLTADGTMTVALGRAYGGSTLVYTGTSLHLPRAVLERWAVPGLDHDDLLERSRRYADENSVHLLPLELINDNNRLFRDGCARLGLGVAQFPINVSGCRGAGVCNLGCPNGAKQGTHEVQLPRAEAGGVEVVTNCRVESIGDRSLDVVVVPATVGHPSRWEPGHHRVRARVVVLAAGAVGSPALMLRSRLPVRLPRLGRDFTCHPAIILVAEHDAPLSNFHGHPKSYYCDHFAETRRFLLETCMYFPFVTAKSLSGFGTDHSRLMARMDHLQMILSLALDPVDDQNRITIDAHGKPVVRYRLSTPVLDALHGSIIEAARIFFAAGARRVHAPAGRGFFIEREQMDRLEHLVPRSRVRAGQLSVSSAHPMGGCRMGQGPEDSVTNSWGQVHDLPWLHVADASLFPRSAEVNPYLTVMALADRVAERIRERGKELLT